MKFVFSLLVGLMALSAQAAEVQGRAELVIWPDYSGGFYQTDIRQEGNKILGRTFEGSGLVNVKVTDGKYEGATGAGLTSLKCDNKGCSGFISGDSADFNYSSVEGSGFKGTIHNNLVSVERSGDRIFVNSSRGTLTLNKTRTGEYEGRGLFNNSIYSQFRATLKTSGTLLDLRDPALTAIFLVAPFSK